LVGSSTGVKFLSYSPAVLDPNVKLAYAEDKWDADQLEDACDRLKEVVRSFPILIISSASSLILSKQFDLYYKPPVASAPDNDTRLGKLLFFFQF
jgi:hypothetical protein